MSLLANQPLPEAVVLNSPSNDAEGNDDWSPDEDSGNPYEAFTSVGTPEDSHAIGELTSTDRPSSSISDSGFAINETFEEKDSFREFARLNIGTKWYRISDFVNWHFTLKVKNENGTLINNGSSQGSDL